MSFLPNDKGSGQKEQSPHRLILKHRRIFCPCLDNGADSNARSLCYILLHHNVTLHSGLDSRYHFRKTSLIHTRVGEKQFYPSLQPRISPATPSSKPAQSTTHYMFASGNLSWPFVLKYINMSNLGTEILHFCLQTQWFSLASHLQI